VTESTKQSIRLGIVGFGQVGRAIASVLARDHALSIFDLNRAQCERHPLVAEGRIVVAESASALAGSVDLLLFCLPTPEASRAVAGEILHAVKPGLIAVETSTVAPENVYELDALFKPRGVRVIDTAVIGGIHALSHGKAVFLVGASEDEAEPIRQVLHQLAAEVFFLGHLGGGMKAKLVANAVAHAVYIVLAEATAVAAAQEIPMNVLYRLLARESGLSRPLTHRIGERLFRGDFAGGMSTANARKDSKLFLETAHRLNVPVFATQAAHAIFEIAAREGMASDDYAIVAKLWEKWAGVKFAQEEAVR
jgi:3-hydroxyisobutyrate dehydrogenase-like beta-hydroxyacid dehydrogenase